jgi:hypothetical protein
MFTEWYGMMVQCKLFTHGNACSVVLFVGVYFVSGLGKYLKYLKFALGWFVGEWLYLASVHVIVTVLCHVTLS